MPHDQHPVVECVSCNATFTDAQVAEHFDAGGKTCPKCGTEKKPRLIGAAARARELANEYLAVKPYLTGRASPAMQPSDMTARQQAGLQIVVWGREKALVVFDALPRNERRRLEKQWPGFRELLARVCEPEDDS